MAIRSRKLPATHPSTQSLDVDQMRLQQLNTDFLELLAAGSTLPDSDDHCNDPHGLRSLPASLSVQLATLPAAALPGIASVGFSLFDLGLHRMESWLQWLQHLPTLDSLHRYTDPAPLNNTSERAQAWQGLSCDALLFALQLAQRQPQTGRVLLGMREETGQLLQHLEPWQCRQLVLRQPQLLSIRWRDNPYLWPDLLHYGRTGDQRQLQMATLLGTQLLARDLEPSAIMRCSATIAE